MVEKLFSRKKGKEEIEKVTEKEDIEASLLEHPKAKERIFYEKLKETLEAIDDEDERTRERIEGLSEGLEEVKDKASSINGMRAEVSEIISYIEAFKNAGLDPQKLVSYFRSRETLEPKMLVLERKLNSLGTKVSEDILSLETDLKDYVTNQISQVGKREDYAERNEEMIDVMKTLDIIREKHQERLQKYKT